jgi:FAD/FMN-containing dehydrogenase/Fe-S oxidoreductase
MASDRGPGGPSRDPSEDAAADYDYASPRVARSELVADLESRVEGEVRFDDYSRTLYATDASAYEVTPVGVVLPRSTDDVAAVVSYCAEREIPVLPRGGGTSLAGQAVNEAVVLDFTAHMDDVVSVDADERRARAQAGAVLAELNAELAPHDLKFAPDPAWGDKSTLGGAVGNNSTGAHSLVYGKTDAYVESCEAVLADGTVTTFGEVGLDELRARADPDGDLEARIHDAVARIVDEEADAVRERYPDLKRNVSGYNLDRVVADAAERGTVNLARLLAGSEGTLAIVTEVEVSLEPVPETAAVALLSYDDLLDAMRDVAPILDHAPCAVEVLDDVLLDLARDTEEFADVVEMLPAGTDSVLLVEFYADSDADGRRQVADLLSDRVPGTDPAGEATEGAADTTDAPPLAVDAMEAHDAERRDRFWKLRKSGLPILLGRTTDEKHLSFIEDTAVPPENLPDYVEEFQSVLDDHDTFASYYAHAGPGVLHIRPLLNTKTTEGVEDMASIADAVTDLVVKYGGSVSGEHGDGRARTQWNRKLYGDHLWTVFRELKTAFDPDWLLNPGQVCGDVAMTEHLRFDPEYEFDAGFDPELSWENENGFEGMAELCHGCGGCRGAQHTTGGVMCPTYRAADEEVLSTRGRANMLRQAMSGEYGRDADDLPAGEQFTEEFATEVLDLCIGCKGCARDCPSEVDVAKMKVEVLHERHQREGASLRDRLFARFDDLARLGSATAPVSNWLSRLPGADRAAERLLGVAAEREVPAFRRTTLRDWFESRGGPAVAAADADREAVLVPDTDTNYAHPAVGKAAVRVLEAAGVRVELAGVTDTGRPAHSLGFLDRARETAREAVDDLAPRVAEGRDVVVVEASDAVMLQSDARDLLDGAAVESVADATYGVCEYLDALDLDVPTAADPESFVYHGHCHQKATKKDGHAASVLRSAGHDVDRLDSTCCGMAGTFGYEAEHHSLSRAIGDILDGQIAASDGGRVVAPGTSCRTQLEDFDRDPVHPVEVLAAPLD